MTPRETWAHDDGRQILTPYDAREAMTLQKAAGRAGKTAGTLRNWCLNHGIGRHVGGQWKVSCVALEMFLEGDKPALAAYHNGDRGSALVAPYFAQFGIPPRSGPAAISLISSK